MLSEVCAQKHKFTWRCHDGRPATCPQCEFEAKEKERKAQRDLQLDQIRQKNQRAYAQQLIDLQDQIAHERRLRKEQNDEAERQKVLQQHREDLENLRKFGLQKRLVAQSHGPGVTTAQPPAPPPEAQSLSAASAPNQQLPSSQMLGSHPTVTSTIDQSDGQPGSSKRRDSPQDLERGKGEWALATSDAKEDWEYQKKFEGASNSALDQLMNMIGLENLKEDFLGIKTKIDTAVRQDVDMTKERFGTALLGNPGTGKINPKFAPLESC